MLPTTVSDVQEAFGSAKNLNAALKNFLKRESRSGEQVASFAKDFRAAVSTGRAAAINAFIEKNYPRKEVYFLGVARYAFPELVESCVGRIIDQHAEAFNKTYERLEQGISIKDAKKFASIVREVHEIVKGDLQIAELPVNGFLENALLSSVFEIDVLTEVMNELSPS
jgi:hypothetical protein